MNVDTKVIMGDLVLRTPLLTGSGTFGYGNEYNTLVDYSKLGGIITKSISLEPRNGNPPPRICETRAGGIINSIGLANVGVDAFLNQKVEALPIGKTEVFISVVGDSVEDYTSVVEKLETIEDIAGYELNISCPNVKSGGLSLGGDKEAVAAITKAVRSMTHRFVSVKLTPHYAVIAPVAEAAVKAGADALTLTNTLVGMAIDAECRKSLLGNVTGGYSGPPLKPVSLAKVWQASQVVDIPIWASGGMVNGIDCIEFMLAGASALQLGSVLFADPTAPERILVEMTEYCERHNVERFSNLIGSLEIQ
ncbi:MAG: dihydroorotate dehydrogenase [Candidatus Hatepunaea meridiana]|nr:dihydroorotate dehydrogenase [Candidatus Hatepunaea meridiana]